MEATRRRERDENFKKQRVIIIEKIEPKKKHQFHSIDAGARCRRRKRKGGGKRSNQNENDK